MINVIFFNFLNVMFWVFIANGFDMNNYVFLYLIL